MGTHVLADGVTTSDGGHTGPVSVNWATLRVLGKFDLKVGGRSIQFGVTSQRLLFLVASRSGQISRVQAAGVLWPEITAPRAAATLRSAVWRFNQCCPDVLQASFHDLQIAPGVAVDIHQASRVASELLAPSSNLSQEQLREALRCNLYDDITPDIGDDDWLVTERERFRQLRVHALEALAGQLITAGLYGAAVEAALGAIRADPFRESAYSQLISAYLAEGSYLEARRQYYAYSELLRTELGLEPSDEFSQLLNNGD